MRILFMGTPDFAVFSLRALVEAGEDVVGVITQPDQPKGRGYVMTPPPVKVYATEQNLPVYQPQTLRSEEFFHLLEELHPDVCVVAAYGKILPQNVLSYPDHGCINLHGSLLPEYRGAAPMQRAIMDGKKVTGVTVMQMEAGLDTGDMLLSEEIPIGENDNFEVIHDRMGECSARLILRAMDGLRNGSLVPVKQDDSASTYAKKIEKEECHLDFSLPARAVHDKIRGLSPVPLSYAVLPDGKRCKIVESEVANENDMLAPAGTVLSLDHGKVTVACGTGSIAILAVVPEGKGKMPASAWINGRKIYEGDRLN